MNKNTAATAWDVLSTSVIIIGAAAGAAAAMGVIPGIKGERGFFGGMSYRNDSGKFVSQSEVVVTAVTHAGGYMVDSLSHVSSATVEGVSTAASYIAESVVGWFK